MKTFTESTEICTAYGIIAAAIMAFLASNLTGCSGIEVGGKLGVYRVDEHREGTSMSGPGVPLACYLWRDCSKQGTESQGS